MLTRQAEVQLTAPVTERVREEQPDGTRIYRSLRTHNRTGRVSVAIDLDKLLQLYARTALLSKGGRSQIANGAVVFRRETFYDVPASDKA